MTSKLSIRELCILALMAALMIASQVAMAALPNIHLVAVFIIIATLAFGWRALFSIAVFVLAEGLIFGFGIWWVSYLYAWPILCVVVMLFRKNDAPLFWAIIAGAHGLLFGAMCAVPYLFIGGAKMAVSYWVAGIPFDLAHCAGNFVVTLVLVKPLTKLTRKFAV